MSGVERYLLNLCGDAQPTVRPSALGWEDSGDYEGVMNDLVTELGENRFNLDFERDFKIPDEITGAVTLLPRLFDNCAITTNFDRVLERAYESDGKAFVEKVTGRGRASAFFRAIPAGERYLLKLHGNLDNATERVLNKAEYDAATATTGTSTCPSHYPSSCIDSSSATAFSFSGAASPWIGPS